MAKYLRKYNKNTQSWEIITTNSAGDVYVSNPHFVENETPITLENTLTNISNSINKLQRNVSWLAEHGGGNGIGGNGVGNSSTYGVMILNSGIKDGTLFVQKSSCKIIFKFTGGTVTDTIQYRIMLDGNVLISSAQAMVNNNISVEIDNLEKFSSTSPHNFLIEGVDKDGMSIPPYILYIVESSIALSCVKENVLRIDGDGVIDITVINKLINTETTITIENKENGRQYQHKYISTTSVATTIPIKFFGNLVDTETMNVGGLYNIEIFGQANTNDGTAITASPITSRVIIQDSANIVLSVNGLAVDGSDEVPIYYLGENIIYNMKCYLQDVSLFYYAIRYRMIDPNTSEEKTMEGIEDVGVYELGEQSYTVNPQMGAGTTVQQNIYLGLTKNEYVGDWKVYIKCWAQGGAISSQTVYCFKIEPNKKGIFPKQIPHLSKDGNGKPIGSTLLAFWDESNFPANSQQAQTWTTTAEKYASPFWTVGSDLVNVTNTMEIYNVNNEANGFIKTESNEKYLRLYNRAYAIAKLNIDSLLTDKSEFKEDAFKYGFTISLCFKSDIHPSNENVVMQWGELGSDNELLDGILVTVDTVLWKFKSGEGNVTENKILKVNIQQNVLTMVDFVYEVHKKEVDGQYSYTGNAKIFINGVLNAATEVKYYKSNFYRNIYLACKHKSNNFSNFSDVDILSLNIFTHFLNDLDVVVNSFNLLCEKNENGTIDESKYLKWKKNNFLDSQSETPECEIYNGGYNSISFENLIKKDIPIPILYLSTSGVTMSEFEETGQSILTNKFPATMKYYDPSNRKYVESQSVAFEIQGTSTTTSGVKNIELYFTNIISINGEDELQLFQPKEDWFPESQFTIKADIVDSAHVNNAFIGKWINESNLLNNTPPMDFVANNPPTDKVLLSDGREDIIKHTKIPKVKHTTEGFPILLMIQFRGQDTPKLYGIFSFNLGRYSYFNLGLKILKNFTRREVNNDLIIENTTPALINYYEYYKHDETTDGTGTNITMSDVYSFEFVSSADENNNDYPTWSQDDESIIKHIGEFKYNGNTGDNTQPAINEDVWKQLKKIFTATAYMPPSYKQYYYDTNGYKPLLDGDGNHKSYQPDLNLYAEMLVKHLHINNCMAYFVIVNAFGLVDSLGKNFTLRTWNSSSDDVIWYPCFYDMDTALGITNSGIESVQPTVYIDYYQNNDDAELNFVKIIRNAAPSEMEIGSTFGAFNLKLWNILRSTNEANAPSDLKSSDKHKGDFYEDVWAKLRDTTINPKTEKSGLLSNVDEVITRLREQLEGCGEMLFNQDYDVKYLQKYGGSSAIEKLHGNRIENIKKWLTDRWIFLDGVFQHPNLNGKDLAFYKSSVFVMAGGQGSILPLTVRTTSPCLIRAEIGQNSIVYTYFVPSYTDTVIRLPQQLSTDKRLTINATSIITKLEGYNAMGLQYFETVNLPLLNTLNLSGVKSLKGNNPINFQEQLMYSGDTGQFSHIRKIDLFDTYTKNVESFEVNLTNFNKLQEINISKSNVTSLNLPSAPLAESSLNIVDSKIKMFKLDNQPLISNIDFSGCTQLESIEINNCKNIRRITIPELPELTSITITRCSNLESFSSSHGGNTSLKEVSILDCKKINTINIGNGYNTSYKIKIQDTPALRELSIVTWYGSSLEIKKSDVSGITKLDLTNCYNLKGIKYNENINGIEYLDGIEYYSGSTSGETGYVMDLTPFTNLSEWKLKNCSSMQYLKMSNTLSKPHILSGGTINGCANLKRIFGHYKLTSHVVRDLTNFRLFDSSFQSYPKVGDFHSNDVNGYDTNLSLGLTSLDIAFRATKVTLNEVYYILQKCNDKGNIMSDGTETYYANSGKNVTNLYLCFHTCPNIRCVNNEFKREAFKYCDKVTSIGSMFLDTPLDSAEFGPILYSPIIETNGTIKSGGTMSYLTSLRSCDGLCRTMYIDQDFFRDNVWSGITSIDGFSPISINKAQDTPNKARGFVNSSIFLSNLGNLETINSSFNGDLKINFEPNTATTNEQQLTYEENLFYHNTKLKSISGSFLNVNGKGDIKNMFGGYPSTKDDKDHFPQQLSAITASFVMSNVNLYIGDSFFDKIASSLTTCNSGTYGGGEYYPFTCTKYIDDNDVNESGFPYNIVQNCTNIVSLVNLFSGIKRENESIYSGKTVSIPSYEDKQYGKVEMFSNCTSLKSIKRLFYNLQIPFTINGFGFENCNLTNVQEAFAENQKMQGYIPYGLFYSPSTKKYSTTSGLTQEEALRLNIDVDYGIKNPVYDENGNLIIEVRYDETQDTNEHGFYPILSGGTYPDGETMNYVDEYGFFHEQNNENNDWESEIKNIRYENHTTFNGTFDTYKTTITNMGGVFKNCKSSQITPYTYEITIDDIDESYGDMRRFSAATINKKYGKLIEANELYNPIYLIVNNAYDPRLYVQDKYTSEYIVNKNYDPRRYIKNPLWNPYPKKWNKWITNGSSSFIEKISGSTLYDALRNHNVIDLESLNELSGIPLTHMHSDDEKKTFGEDSQGVIKLTQELREKLNQRNYMFAPDILRYCDATTTDLKVNSLFQRDSGGYLSNGFYGVLPPFMFETLSNIKYLTNCFNGVNITPYKFGVVESTYIPGSNDVTIEYFIGEMFNDKLFSNLNELYDLTGCFSHIHIPSSVKISGTLFENNGKLSILDSLFYDVKWYGLNSGLSTTYISQIDGGLFSGNKEITSVQSMFAYWYGSGQIDKNYRLSIIPSPIFFSRTSHPKLQRISSLFADASIKVKRKEDCIAFWEWKPIPSEYINCYKGVDDTSIPPIIPPAFKGM